jgi:hypothetical protein
MYLEQWSWGLVVASKCVAQTTWFLYHTNENNSWTIYSVSVYVMNCFHYLDLSRGYVVEYLICDELKIWICRVPDWELLVDYKVVEVLLGLHSMSPGKNTCNGDLCPTMIFRWHSPQFSTIHDTETSRQNLFLNCHPYFNKTSRSVECPHQSSTSPRNSVLALHVKQAQNLIQYVAIDFTELYALSKIILLQYVSN